MARFVVEEKVTKPLEIGDDDVVGLVEAGRRLGLSPSAVADLCLRGQLRRILDMDEPNPRKRGRVLVADLEAELARRRGNKDGRLRGRGRGRRR